MRLCRFLQPRPDGAPAPKANFLRHEQQRHKYPNHQEFTLIVQEPFIQRHANDPPALGLRQAAGVGKAHSWPRATGEPARWIPGRFDRRSRGSAPDDGSNPRLSAGWTAIRDSSTAE